LRSAWANDSRLVFVHPRGRTVWCCYYYSECLISLMIGDRIDAKEQAMDWILAFVISMPASQPTPEQPTAEYVVADRWWSSTRPVYDFTKWARNPKVRKQIEIGRAPRGAPCGHFIEYASDGKAWYTYQLENGVHGVTLCAPKE
jgi:hypothetical protein